MTPAKLARLKVDAWDLFLKRHEAVTSLLRQLNGLLNSPGTPEQAIDRQATAQKLAAAAQFKNEILGEAACSFALLVEAEIRHCRKPETGLLI